MFLKAYHEWDKRFATSTGETVDVRFRAIKGTKELVICLVDLGYLVRRPNVSTLHVLLSVFQVAAKVIGINRWVFE